MLNLNIFKTFGKLLFLFCLTMLLSGCLSTTGKNIGRDCGQCSVSKQEFEKKASSLYKESNYARTSDEKAKLLVDSAYYYAKAFNAQEAEKIIHKLPKYLPDNNTTNKAKLVKSKIVLLKDMPYEAISELNGVSVKDFPYELKKDYYETKSNAYYRQGNIVTATKDRIHLNSFLKTEVEIKQNKNEIWKYLQQLTPNKLRELQQEKSISKELKGWLAFSYLSKQYDAAPDQVIRALKLWKKRYKEHDANDLIPELSDVSKKTMENNKPKKIGLLLPLTQGPYKEQAQAIKNGFIAASYSFYEKNSYVPTVKLYDTSKMDVVAAYKLAIKDGVNFIVGPLVKKNVELLRSSGSLSVPVVALNGVSNLNFSFKKNNFYEFGLLPESEAIEAANKAKRDGKQRALIIVPKDAWGNRILSSFKTQWKMLDGEIAGIAQFESNNTLDTDIQKLLLIDSSKNRAKELRRSGIKIAFTPRCREDVDFIFMAAPPPIARQIKPLLNFHYAKDIPVYASSSVYSGFMSTELDQDLDKIQFCDIPWVLDETIKLKRIYKTISSKWPEQYHKYPRLFAFGIDAYKISQQLEQLLNFSEIGISGMTGILRLDDKNIIHRKLMWSKFEKGKVNLLIN